MNNTTQKIWWMATIIFAISAIVVFTTPLAWAHYVMWTAICIQWACLLTPKFQKIFNKK